MTRLSIPDMSCGHCRASIEGALAPLPGFRSIRFDQENRTAEVEGQVPEVTLLSALDSIGFPAQILR
ncbi:heavy-metal-associated domain-containing protein [Cereibacter azotoformans]|uniref:Copper chaperone n=1 Tax=Cereibacter azotoformans TaxID=43057 RepID=A0A2T5K997_9RHOB|nr:heavy metal-associated domain-containing protein [Cereibacter azotoformans]AXQ93279.1 heavy-metal-associated domain-containing protein [Cereibacter sphaeroides]MBO4169061.1 heavy-metal-associated domain-containing protein [Cereibacter azotoformans]PTR18995.1 copper chaperone [Cereibacter azotoformans]UIJ31592.1 heavy-metal-associated domain-containing protein [Cereibacter azotoformans]ULB09379.1 heavy-metal-associated domain-containing protein [Cereibacter azotoformans]